MNPTEMTYFLIRRAEEAYGAPVAKGDILVYRNNPRFPWFGEHFDLEPGARLRIEAVKHDPATSPDHDPCDNHYHYHISGMAEHGGLSTTEILAWFDPEIPNDFDRIAQSIVDYLEALLGASHVLN